MEKWRAIVNTVKNLWFPLNAEKFLTSSETVNFSRHSVPWNQFEIRMLNVTRKYIIQ